MASNRTLPRRSNRPQRVDGYAMILFLAIISMGLLYSLVSRLDPAALKASQGASATDAQMQAKEALLAFAATYRDRHDAEMFGYLPCPDTDVDGEAEGSCGSAGNGAIGLLPYKTLGLQDLRDSSGVCLWYSVSGTFKDNPKHGTQPLNWDTPGQFRVNQADGTALVAPDDPNGGAAAVIFAAGAPLTDQNRTAGSGTCAIDPSQVAAYLDGNYNFQVSSTIVLMQGIVTASSDSNVITVNDRLAWITPKEIFDRILKRNDLVNALTDTPVGSLNKLGDQIRSRLEKYIQDDLMAGTAPTSSIPANTGSFAQPAGKAVGNITAALTSLSDGNYDEYLHHWREQFKMAVCQDLSSGCLTVGTKLCRGGLFLGGRGGVVSIDSGGKAVLTAKPRSTAEKALLASYFETAGAEYYPGAYDLLTSGAAFPSTGATAFNKSHPSADVGLCLMPGNFVSFARDIAQFNAGKVTAGANSSLVTVTTTSENEKVTLGTSSSGAGSGCVWYPTALSTNEKVRMYFKVRYTLKGNGFTLALADAATNLAPDDPARTQDMCGDDTTASMGYAGPPPGGSNAGIKVPKVGLEFDSRYGQGQNDPHNDHLAFLFWGSAGDNASSGSGNDDVTHYNGSGGMALASASWSGNLASFTTASAHGLSAGQTVVVSGVSPEAYNGTHTVSTSGLSTTAFGVTLNLTTNPGSGSGGRVRAGSIGGFTLNGATYDSGSITFSTGSPHGLSPGQIFAIKEATPHGYNGTYIVAAVPTTTTVAAAISTNPGLFASGGTGTRLGAEAPRNPRVATASRSIGISSASWSSNQAKIITSGNHNLAAGQKVHVSGVCLSEYNGYYSVLASGLTATEFKYTLSLGSNPGSVTTNPSCPNPGIVVQGTEISSLTENSGTATAVSMESSHGLSSGLGHSIRGITPSTFESSGAVVTSIAGNRFTYSASTNAGDTFTAETPAGMMLVRKTNSTPHGYLYFNGFPLNTDIHVRIDISRRYDTTNRIAILDLKAYVGNSFPLDEVCDVSDFQNLSNDMAEICPSRTPSLQQDSVPIGALADVTGITWSGGVATVTTGAAHKLVNGAQISILGALPIGYNGIHTISVTGTSTFTFPLATSPGSYVSGGGVEPLRKVFMGFTTARSTAIGNQDIAVSNLVLRSE